MPFLQLLCFPSVLFTVHDYISINDHCRVIVLDYKHKNRHKIVKKANDTKVSTETTCIS